MKISLIQPSRNNLKYLKWSYDSIRKNQGDHEVQICVADDASTDGTWEWCMDMMEHDHNFAAIKNETGKRLGQFVEGASAGSARAQRDDRVTQRA